MDDQTGTRITWESLVRFQRELSVLEGKSDLFLSALTRESNRPGITEQEKDGLAVLMVLAREVNLALSLAAHMTQEWVHASPSTLKQMPSYTPDGKTAKGLPST